MKAWQKWAAAALLWYIVGVLAVVAVLVALPAQAAQPFTGKVIGVADGDTLTVLADTMPRKIRLAEIDAPEKKQAWGERAKQSLSDLCFNAEATVAAGVTDRYGRTVARVRCAGVDASLYQVQHGLAWAYTRYLHDPAIAAAAQAARASGIGLWADANPTPPWLYRKGARP
ncbi:MAG: thermonuclease family protein [Betaproteobacteria bacterium]|nr:thermonuclease family protein [Betaproteobacteria bacterium]